MGINWFDARWQSIISRFSQIQPNSLPVVLTCEVYLTESGQCCIGGYHSPEGSVSNPQAYAHATYVDHPGDFAQDVSALSHEVGEWADDPLGVHTNGNNTQCGILEVGDPLEGEANFGGFPYTLNGFTYNLQDLVPLPYFGAPTSTSVNGRRSFQGNSSLSVCSNGSSPAEVLPPPASQEADFFFRADRSDARLEGRVGSPNELRPLRPLRRGSMGAESGKILRRLLWQ